MTRTRTVPRIVAGLGVLALPACDHWFWEDFDPAGATAATLPGTSTDSDSGGTLTTGGPGGTDPTSTSYATSSDATTAGDQTTAGTTEDPWNTTGAPVPVCNGQWEVCEDGDDDNGDSHAQCTGSPRASASLSATTDLGPLYVAPAGEPGKFWVIGDYEGTTNLDGAPASQDHALFAAGFSAADGVLVAPVVDDSIHDDQLVAFRRTAGGRMLLVVDRGQAAGFVLMEFTGEQFVLLQQLPDEFTTIKAFASDGVIARILGHCDALEPACIYTTPLTGAPTFASPQSLDLPDALDILLLPGRGDAALVAGAISGDGVILRVDSQKVDQPAAQATLEFYTQMVSGKAAVDRIALGPDLKTLFSVGWVAGEAGNLGPANAQVCGPMIACANDSRDLFLAAFDRTTMDLQGATRAITADGFRYLETLALEVDGAGQPVVSGYYWRVLAFAPEDVTPIADTLDVPTAFVAKFGLPSTLANLWVHRAPLVKDNQSLLTSIAVDPCTVAVTGRTTAAISLGDHSIPFEDAGGGSVFAVALDP